LKRIIARLSNKRNRPTKAFNIQTDKQLNTENAFMIRQQANFATLKIPDKIQTRNTHKN